MHYIDILLVMLTLLVSLPNCRISFRKGHFSEPSSPQAVSFAFTSRLYTRPASGTYRGAAGAGIPQFRYQPADLHRYWCQRYFPCRVPASNPLMELAASIASLRSRTDSSSKSQTVRFGSWTYFTTSRVMVR